MALPGTDAPDELTPLELASGMVRGVARDVVGLPAAPAGLTARAALRDVVRRALSRPPCVVSFSGGRDSSMVLALATDVARREGLPLPVPVSQRFPEFPEADEDQWQELVVRHLDLPEWVRLRFTDELDVVGPVARSVLGRCGVLWPPNAHFHLPVAERAATGTLLTGFGGDELLDPGWAWSRLNQALARRRRWERRDLLRLVVAVGPRPIRTAAMRRQLAGRYTYPWIRPAAAAQIARNAIRDRAAEPLRWDRGTDRSWWRTRYRRTVESSLQRVSDVHDVSVVHPLTDPTVLATVAREGGRTGFASRSAAVTHLVGDLLPPDVPGRRTKAVLTRAFWNRHCRAFVATWDGSGVDPEVVDVDALRDMWLARDAPPDARTFGLLQSAWLARDRAARPRCSSAGA